ncbi:MAG: hypothetical protein EXS09_06805 [Gemmataceae bacterium]|nr:hypothetical protein [Gemmataceae bacterium]
MKNLQGFYRKHYRVDLAMLVIARQYDERKALEYIVKYFASWPSEYPVFDQLLACSRRSFEADRVSAGLHFRSESAYLADLARGSSGESLDTSCTFAVRCAFSHIQGKGHKVVP